MKELRWLFLATIAVVIFVGFWSAPITIGASAQWSNGSYRFAGGTTPVALVLALIISALYLLLMFGPPPDIGNPFPGVFRRFVAFWLDFLLVMMVIGPVVGVLPTFTEWRRTRNFQWNFERATPAPGDGWLVSAGLIFCVVALLLYYAFPLIRRRPSPGGCIAGYQIVADDGVVITPRTALLRTLLGFVATGAPYLAPFVVRDRKKGKFWLDVVFGTRAVKLV